MNSKGIKVSSPTPLLQRKVTFDLVPVFTGLAKGVAHAATGNFNEAGGDLADVVAGLGLDQKAGESWYLLIERALFTACLELTRESISHFNTADSTAEIRLSAALESALRSVELTITPDFFRRPKNSQLLKEVSGIFEQWLVDMGIAPRAASLIASRLDSYYVYALAAEWRKNHASYKDLIGSIDTPFGAAEANEQEWESYFAVLSRRIDENVFDEPFGLSQIYVPLKASFSQGRNHRSDDEFSGSRQQVVVDLYDEVLGWIKARDRADSIRVLSGGPGSGKSSFTKILCAQVSEQRLARPIYIPLHLIDPTNDIADEIGKFVRDEGFLSFNPLDPDLGLKDLVIVFDGLDELASQGKVAAQVAKDFILAVDRLVEKRNLGPNPILVLVSGRELIIQENASEFRKDRQVLNVLPYFIAAAERHGFHDPDSHLDDDLRDKWWTKYGSLTGHKFTGLPAALKKHEIDEITAQPLLNYLVALSYARGQIKFGSSLNLNAVYEDLVAAVYERAYEKKRIYKPISHMSRAEFIRVMEEIGLAAWHGSDGRSTSVNEIISHCKDSGIESLITSFQEGAKAGVTKLLAAFFFRQQGRAVSGDATFVFTHKSFGEYLTSLRLVRGIDRMVIQLQRRVENPDDGFDTAQGLLFWAKLTGPAQMSSYIHRFLIREIAQVDASRVSLWHEQLSKLLNHAIEKNIPMEKLGILTFAEAQRQHNNACESLVIALNACAIKLKKTIPLKLSDRAAFGTFLRRLCPQRVGPKSPILYNALSYFDFSGQYFDLADLYGANLEATVWRNASAHYTNFASAQMRGATLHNLRMPESDLSSTDLTNSNLVTVDLQGCKLVGTRFENVTFEDVDMRSSDVEDADFTGARFIEVKSAGVAFNKVQSAQVLVDSDQDPGRTRHRAPPRRRLRERTRDE